MSEYATESPVSLRRRRKRRRALITIGIVLLGLFFAFWYALSYYETDTTPTAPAAAGAATCRTPDPNEVAPGDVKVRVLNASNRNGLAAATAKALGSRGFVIRGAANDTSKRKPPAVAEIRYGPDGEARAKLLQSVMPKGTTLVNDKRKGTDVDVALGAKFTQLRPPATPTSTPLPDCPSPSGP